jgi:phage portal protein BeeE
MILDVDMAGNFFGVELDGEIVRLRPDWVEIALTERWVNQNGELVQVGWQRLGYLYYEGGRTGARPAVFLPEEVIHFAPNPDPLASWRGMSWLTPVVREIMADSQATKHKLKFFENAATPNIAVALPKEVPVEEFNDFVDAMDASHRGADNAYKTMYTAGGADITVIGTDMRQIDFKVTQGAGESGWLRPGESIRRSSVCPRVCRAPA